MLFDIGLVVIGFVLLYFGARGVLLGTLSIANKFDLPVLIVTIVIVGIGTNIPEIAVSISAAKQQAANIALGNVIGSNIANILFALGIAAVAQTLIITRRHTLDVLVLVAANALLVICLWLHWLSLAVGITFIVLLVVYLIISAYVHKNDAPKKSDKIKTYSLLMIILFLVFGLAALLLGSSWFVKGIIAIGVHFGISEDTLGLSVVAFATSLPEAVSLYLAAKQKQVEFIIGTVLGSNIFNCLALTGIVLLIRTPKSVVDLHTGAIVMLLVNLFFASLILAKIKISRYLGVAMLLVYIVYLALFLL